MTGYGELLELHLKESKDAASKFIIENMDYLNNSSKETTQSFLLWNYPVSNTVLSFLFEEYYKKTCTSFFSSQKYKETHLENLIYFYQKNPNRFIHFIIERRLFLKESCIWLFKRIHSSLEKNHRETLKEWIILSKIHKEIELERRKFLDFTNTLQLDNLFNSLFFTIECLRLIEVSKYSSFDSGIFIQDKSDLLDTVINEWLKTHSEDLESVVIKSADTTKLSICNKLYKGFIVLEDHSDFDFYIIRYQHGDTNLKVKGQNISLGRTDEIYRQRWRKQHYKYILENKYFSNLTLMQENYDLSESKDPQNTHFYEKNCYQFGFYQMPAVINENVVNNFAVMNFFSQLINERNQDLFTDKVEKGIQTFEESYEHMIKIIKTYYLENRYPSPYIRKNENDYEQSLTSVTQGHYDADKFQNRYLFNIKNYNKDKKYSFWETPLISDGQSVIIPGCMLMPYNFARTEFNKIFSQWGKKEIKDYSDNIEKYIAQMFKQVGFKVENSFTFSELIDDKSRVLCEADIIAVKGNTIIVLELKLTTLRADPTSIYLYKDRTFFNKAVDQLQKIKKRLIVHRDWEKLPPHLLESLSQTPEVYSFIISNNFEGDGEEYPDGILKLSILELRIILSNSARFLVDFDLPYEELLKIKNLTLKDLEENPYSLDDPKSKAFLNKAFEDLVHEFNLYPDKNELTAEQFKKIVQEEQVWKLLNYMEEKPSTFVSMKYGRKNIKIEL